MVHASLHEQVVRIKTIEVDMHAIEARLQLQLKQDSQMQRIAQIPSMGLLTATAAIGHHGLSIRNLMGSGCASPTPLH